VLARLLTAPDVTKQNIELALQAYDNIRLESTWKLMECSRRQGLVYGLRENAWSDTSDLQELLQIIKENTEWILKWDIEDDIKRGLDWIGRQRQ
jgi:hypothetical protein